VLRVLVSALALSTAFALLVVPGALSSERYSDPCCELPNLRAPDVTKVEVGNTRTELEFTVWTESQPELRSDLEWRVLTDSDRNPATGGHVGRAALESRGVDYAIELLGTGVSRAYRWTGNKYEVGSPLRSSYEKGVWTSSASIDDVDPTSETVDFRVETSQYSIGGHNDYAPDTKPVPESPGYYRIQWFSYELTGARPDPRPGDEACRPYVVLSSAGSGELRRAGAPGRKLVATLRARLGAENVAVLSSPAPAAGRFTLERGQLRAPDGYDESVDAGRHWLRERLRELRASCDASTRLVVTGFGLGAQVAGDVVQEDGVVAGKLRKMLLGVVLFGDPLFNGRDLQAGRGGFEPGRHGALGRRARFADSLFTNRTRVLSYCHANDPVCQLMRPRAARLHRFSQHRNYAHLGEPVEAANRLADLVDAERASRRR
jgi:Cutinase